MRISPAQPARKGDFEAAGFDVSVRRFGYNGFLPISKDHPLFRSFYTIAGAKKHIEGSVVGAADIMLFPNLLSANLTVKAIMYTADCQFGGVLSAVPNTNGSSLAWKP